MGLNPSLKTVEKLYGKLEREAYRAYHERNKTHKADHFYNFCITAQALRDYFFERKGLIRKDQQEPYNVSWSQNEYLVGVSEIANSAKHCILREPRTRKIKKTKTKDVKDSKSKFIDIYRNEHGVFSRVLIEAPDYIVTVENGSKYDLYTFTEQVLKYWRSFLRDHSVMVRRQSLKKLIGEDT